MGGVGAGVEGPVEELQTATEADRTGGFIPKPPSRVGLPGSSEAGEAGPTPAVGETPGAPRAITGDDAADEDWRGGITTRG